MNATQFRASLFTVIRRVLSTGEPVDIEWKGQHMQLASRESKSPSGKLARLRPHPEALRGDPDSIVHLDWSSEWQGDDGSLS